MATFTAEELKNQFRSTTGSSSVPNGNMQLGTGTFGIPEKKPGFGQNVGTAFNKRVDTASNALVSKQNIGSKALQTLGQGAGFVGDVAFEGIKAVTPDFIEKPVGEFVGGAVKKVAETKPAQDAIGGYESWKSQHPEAAANLEATINIGSLLPIGAGAKVGIEGAKVAGKVGVKATTATAKGVGNVTGSAVRRVTQGTPEQQAVKADEKLMELIREQPNKRSAIQAFEQAGKPGGVVSKGRTQKYQIEPTDTDRARLEAVRGIVDPKKDVVKNNTLINNEISRTTQEELLPFLQSNPRAFNVATINSRLRSIEMPDLFKADATLQNTYNLVRQRMVNAINANPKTMEGLWNARKQFDREVQDQFGDAAFDSEKNTAIKRAIQDVRRETNAFIGESIGDEQFAQYMQKLTNMYDARDNMSEKAYKLLNSDKYRRKWLALSPRQRAVVLWGTGIVGATGATGIVYAGN